MAISQALLDQLMDLSDEDRLELAELLLATVDDDDLDDAERARLHAALARSMEAIKAGRFRDAHDVIAEFRARHRP